MMEARTCQWWSVLGNKPTGLQTCAGEHGEHPPLSLACSQVPSKRGGGPSAGETGEEREVGGSPRQTAFTSQPRLRREQRPSHCRGTASPLGSSLLQPQRREGPGWHSSQLSVVHRFTLHSVGPPHAQQAMLPTEDRKFSHRDSSPQLPGHDPKTGSRGIIKSSSQRRAQEVNRFSPKPRNRPQALGASPTTSPDASLGVLLFYLVCF